MTIKTYTPVYKTGNDWDDSTHYETSYTYTTREEAEKEIFWTGLTVVEKEYGEDYYYYDKEQEDDVAWNNVLSNHYARIMVQEVKEKFTPEGGI